MDLKIKAENLLRIDREDLSSREYKELQRSAKDLSTKIKNLALEKELKNLVGIK